MKVMPQKNTKKAYIKTFGCQMNVHDSEKMAGILRDEGYELTSEHKDADVIIMNTCSVREKAEQKFFSDLGRMKHLKDDKPHKKIIATGCIAQQMGEDVIKRAPHVDMVIGPQNYHELARLLRESENGNGQGGGAGKAAGIAIEDNPALAEMELPTLRTKGPRAWVSIMYGCNNFCTYCIVPHTRGREKSRPFKSIVEEVRGLSGQGYTEITLLGQNVNSYDGAMGKEGDFPALLEALDAIDGIERIRFITSHPRDLSDRLIESIAGLDSVCEHLHLPLQSGSTEVLRAMNRRYNYAEYKDKVDRLRKSIPGIAITTDIIAGFPGETEENHKSTLDALAEIRYDGIFAFRYSERPGTKATEMEGGLPEKVRLRRLHEILDLQENITLEINQGLIDSIQEILYEGPVEGDQDRRSGRTRSNKIVNFRHTGHIDPGALLLMRITKAHKHSLTGQIHGGSCE